MDFRNRAKPLILRQAQDERWVSVYYIRETVLRQAQDERLRQAWDERFRQAWD